VPVTNPCYKSEVADTAAAAADDADRTFHEESDDDESGGASPVRQNSAVVDTAPANAQSVALQEAQQAAALLNSMLKV
jgi:hypothetical protein